jgi:murein DD-endopeptidase MepM/ murein hydrolase activator NlpD
VIDEPAQENSGSDKRRAARSAAAVLVILIAAGTGAGFAVVGSIKNPAEAAGISGHGPAGEAVGKAVSQKSTLSSTASLAPSKLSASDPESAEKAAVEIVRAAMNNKGKRGEKNIEAAFPSGREIMALLALDRDIEDYRAHSTLKGATGRYYREQIQLCLGIRPLRTVYERAFAAAQAELSGGKTEEPAMSPRKLALYLAKAPSPFTKADYWFASKSELKYAHPYALDVFFKRFTRENGAHTGPKIRALYPGIVVAAAGDWEGGAGAASYIRGGLSPAAGNGVVVFDRITRRYYVYLHLKEIAVEVGDIVKAGEVLGRGGNTGMNARRPDHGGHVHIEIFDCGRGTALRGAEILDIIKR